MVATVCCVPTDKTVSFVVYILLMHLGTRHGCHQPLNIALSVIQILET